MATQNERKGEFIGGIYISEQQERDKDTSMPVVRRGPNFDDSTMPYWNYAIDATLLKNNEKKQVNFGVQRPKEIKVAERKIAGSLHICKNCLAMFESNDKYVRSALCTDCIIVEASTKIRKRSEQSTTQERKNKADSDMPNIAEVKTSISNILIDNCLKRIEETKENSIFVKVKGYVWPFSKAVTCMNVQDKVPSKKKSKINSKELGTFENKFRQIVKVVRSKNSDGSVSEERKTITIKTERTKPCSQDASAHSSSSVRKSTNVTNSFKETSSKKDATIPNTSKSHSKARQTRSEKISLIDTLAAPRLKTSLSDDTVPIISIDSNVTKEADRMTVLMKKESVTHIIPEEKTDEPCICDVPEKTSKVRIKDVCSIHALRPAKTLMELTNNQKLKSPVHSENVSLVSFATSYSLNEGSIQMSAQDVLKSELSEDKTICTDVSDNKIGKDTVCSTSFIRQIGTDDDEKTKIVNTNARWRDVGAATSTKNRIFSIPSYTEVARKLFSVNHGYDLAFENETNVSDIEPQDNSDTNANASNATQTQESSFPVACQSTDRSPKLIDEFGFQLPTSKMFTRFPDMMANKNVSNNYSTDRPAVKSFDFKSNEMKRLEEMYKKMKNRQNESIYNNSKPSAAFPKFKKETKDKLQSDSVSRLSHDIPIRTKTHNESPRVSGEIIYSNLDPKLVRKCNKAAKEIKDYKHLKKSDAMVETDTRITDIHMPVTESRGTSPVGSFPLIPLKIHEVVPKNYDEPPRRVTVATSPELSLAKLPVISTSSQLTLTQNVLNNELPKIPSVLPPDKRGLESNSICEIKIVSKNFNYNTLASQDTEITVERLKKLLKNNNVKDLEKIIHPTVKQLTKVPAETNFPRPHIVCAVTPLISEAEIKASSCNSMGSCPNPDCPVKKMCCPPKPEKKPEPAGPQEKVDVAVSTFERDKPKRKVDFEESTCKSTCVVPVELPKCAKCRATLQRADASTSTKNNVRYDVRPLSKLIFTRVITETQSDSCLYCGKPCGKPGFRRTGQRNIKSPSASFHSCTKPIPKAESSPTCRFADCDC